MYNFKEKLNKVITLILAAALFAAVFAGCDNSSGEKFVSLTIATTTEQANIITAMANAFNKETEGVKISVKIYSGENEKNYYLSHYEDDSELITFDYAQEAIYNSDCLQKLDRMSVTNRYLVSTINYLKDYDGSLYALPSNGRYYTRIYNADALERYGLTVPQTINELLTFSSRLKESASGVGYSSATLGGNASVLFALMSVAYPLFLNTVKGTAFLNGVINGKLSFNDEEFRDSWREVFEYFKLLYDNNFYSLDAVNKTPEEELEYFKSGKAAAKQNDGKASLSSLFKTVNGECAPFVGKTARDACIGSAPLFYLSLTSNAGTSYEKQAAAKKFLSYFSSAKGQSFVNAYLKNDEYVSYLKGEDVLSEVYRPVADRKRVGMLFINDSFNYAFGFCVSDLCDYLNSKTSLDSLLTIIDEKIKDGHNSESFVIAEVEKKYELTDSAYEESSSIGEFFIQAIAKSSYLDCAVIPASYIKCSLLKGTLTENDLEAVFPSKPLCYAEIAAEDFLRLCVDIDENDSYPLVYGAKYANGKLYKKSGKEYLPTESVYVLIPSDKKTLLPETAVFGTEVSSKTILLSYFGANYTVLR